MSYIPTPDQFRRARKLLRLRQADFHRKIGIPQSAISLIERGRGAETQLMRNYKRGLRRFSTTNGVIFPSNGEPPIQADVNLPALGFLRNVKV